MPESANMEKLSSTGGIKLGIAPSILIDQVRNTAPFLFAQPVETRPDRRFLNTITQQSPDTKFGHADYFDLCLSAHHSTVATFVPTDVDIHIRLKLWASCPSQDELSQMGKIVLESYRWDSTEVSTRWVKSPDSEQVLSGHTGEWFSTAAAAYGALRKKLPQEAADIAGTILRELHREADIFAEFTACKDGIGALKAATLIAHNLGDLDRVIDLWNLKEDDALRQSAYKAGHNPIDRFLSHLYIAGEVNKALMASENHRHFALRKPRCLRKSKDLLLPLGPFLDDWGATVAKHPALSPDEVSEVVEALVEGWERLPETLGYPRALSGILENFPGGLSKLSQYLPAKTARILKAGPLRTLTTVSKKRFEDQWNQMALKALQQKRN